MKTWHRRGNSFPGLTESQQNSLIRCLPEDGMNGFFVALFIRKVCVHKILGSLRLTTPVVLPPAADIKQGDCKIAVVPSMKTLQEAEKSSNVVVVTSEGIDTKRMVISDRDLKDSTIENDRNGNKGNSDNDDSEKRLLQHRGFRRIKKQQRSVKHIIARLWRPY